ncbi:MAG: HAMP domain-containing histidine kinase [Acidobacteria bacterium]|nr:HAMP domain-containing histidine kinase [Acidobacteriota bacterium]
MSRRRLISAFAIVLGLPALTVAWLAWSLLRQDQALEKQRLFESRELAASQAVQTLSTLLANPRLFTDPPAPGALLAHPPTPPLLFLNETPPAPEPPRDTFHPAESLEFQQNALPQAIALYRTLAASPDARVRAGALFRLARCLHKAGRTDAALDTYLALARLQSAFVAGWPAPIAALWSRCLLLESSGRSQPLRSEARELSQLLASGRHPLARPAYSAFADDAARWSGSPRPDQLELLTEAALAIQASDPPPSGRTILLIRNTPITAVWSRTPSRLSVFVASPDYVLRHWLSRAGPGIWLRHDSGATIGPPSSAQASIRYPAESRLPWAVLAATPPSPQDLSSRRRLLLLLLAAVAILTLAGAYAVLRSFRRELALARLQEDFLAAVSHEFCTPLTSIRQISESLEDNRVPSEEKRAALHRSLSRATHRLQRLVEDLLDFRRMQSGALVYHRSLVSVRPFTASLAADFQREVEDHGFTLQSSPAPDLQLLADPEALARALWNLLDNAVKYSAAARTVELHCSSNETSIQWSVRDHGIGISPSDRPHLFQRFYRAEAARRSGIRGAGIGLAIVHEIVKAHGGGIDLYSIEGQGTTITISIPIASPIEGAPCTAS